MVQRRADLRLSVEATQPGRIPHTARGQHLQRAATLHEPMFGEVHGAHATLPHKPQQLVLPKMETAVLTLQQLRRLPAGQHTALDQLSSNLLRGIHGTRGRQSKKFGVQLFPVCWRQQPALPQALQEALDRQPVGIRICGTHQCRQTARKGPPLNPSYGRQHGIPQARRPPGTPSGRQTRANRPKAADPRCWRNGQAQATETRTGQRFGLQSDRAGNNTVCNDAIDPTRVVS